ncbi:alpha-protein kinase 1-like [Bactrocera neohumeralis]|uniref:alpha-protein kinase 1-like n=1 Tax=Bactrocera tryoni TaxID=59916 RepID=UPI001A989D7A|nr:alpha-protein kinase 1-like [Bactrocera tryoni]XP_050328092.1 alpha-protein kinase 1-like [Bactrocera neohumeralis]
MRNLYNCNLPSVTIAAMPIAFKPKPKPTQTPTTTTLAKPMDESTKSSHAQAARETSPIASKQMNTLAQLPKCDEKQQQQQQYQYHLQQQQQQQHHQQQHYLYTEYQQWRHGDSVQQMQQPHSRQDDAFHLQNLIKQRQIMTLYDYYMYQRHPSPPMPTQAKALGSGLDLRAEYGRVARL